MKIEKNQHKNFLRPDLDQNLALEQVLPEKHHGHIIEKEVRKANIGISEIARHLHVSRRTLYNWFEIKTVSLDIIIKVGQVIGHDFSTELPEEFSNENINSINHGLIQPFDSKGDKKEVLYYWMERYIKLLENVNQNLTNNNAFKNEVIN